MVYYLITILNLTVDTVNQIVYYTNRHRKVNQIINNIEYSLDKVYVFVYNESMKFKKRFQI